MMLKTSTIIKESPKKLDVASLMADIATASKTVTLSSLESLDVFQKVTVNIKVVELKDETQVGGRVKRDVSVADAPFFLMQIYGRNHRQLSSHALQYHTLGMSFSGT